MYGRARIIEVTWSVNGDEHFRRLLIAAGARARLLRWRKEASLIDRELYEVTHRMLREGK